LESGSGDLRLARLTGEMHFHTARATSVPRNFSGPIYGRAGSGDPRFLKKPVRGDATLKTGSGNIHLQGLGGRAAGQRW